MSYVGGENEKLDEAPISVKSLPLILPEYGLVMVWNTTQSQNMSSQCWGILADFDKVVHTGMTLHKICS